jgi:hypothetical protein
VTDEETTESAALTPIEELRVLSQIMARVEKLNAAGRAWLQSWLSAQEAAQ